MSSIFLPSLIESSSLLDGLVMDNSTLFGYNTRRFTSFLNSPQALLPGNEQVNDMNTVNTPEGTGKPVKLCPEDGKPCGINCPMQPCEPGKYCPFDDPKFKIQLDKGHCVREGCPRGGCARNAPNRMPYVLEPCSMTGKTEDGKDYENYGRDGRYCDDKKHPNNTICVKKLPADFCLNSQKLKAGDLRPGYDPQHTPDGTRFWKWHNDSTNTAILTKPVNPQIESGTLRRTVGSNSIAGSATGSSSEKGLLSSVSSGTANFLGSALKGLNSVSDGISDVVADVVGINNDVPVDDNSDGLNYWEIPERIKLGFIKGFKLDGDPGTTNLRTSNLQIALPFPTYQRNETCCNTTDRCESFTGEAMCITPEQLLTYEVSGHNIVVDCAASKEQFITGCNWTNKFVREYIGNETPPSPGFKMNSDVEPIYGKHLS